jgi:hypothetical protein
MPISVVEPVSPAIEQAKRVCFRSFDLGKWFVMGFSAFLAGFVEGGASVPNFNAGGQSGPGGGGPGGGSVREAVDWVGEHIVLLLVIALVVLAIAVALGALFTWLGSRGQFLFLDNVTRNRGAVVEPWHEYRREGNSSFLFRFLFGLAVLAAVLLIVAAAGVLALGDLRAGTFGAGAVAALVVGGSGLFLVWVVAAVVTLFLDDCVVPIMYLRRVTVMEGWRVFRTDLLADRAGTFVLYILFKILIDIVVGLLTLLLTCVTLCIALIPYLGTHVLLLPLHVFKRSYSLYFLQQFGPEWQFFGSPGDLPPEPPEGYDDLGPADERIRPAEEGYRPGDEGIRQP